MQIALSKNKAVPYLFQVIELLFRKTLIAGQWIRDNDENNKNNFGLPEGHNS
jgi:hypothetical protein